MKNLKLLWINLVLALFWFLVIIVIFSIYFGGNGTAEAEIPQKISDNIATLILIVQVLIFATLYFSCKKDNFSLFKEGWKLPNRTLTLTDIAYGVITGLILSVIYFYILSPFQTYLQKTIGDYVPSGETMNALGKQPIQFFIANVVFAPFVEESLYRNYSLTRFQEKFSVKKSILLSALFFGLLHWTGGFWYILMTGLFIGIPFAIITVKRKSILWVFVAHLTLNLIEFVYINYNA